ncbi:23382_t:CDS:2 [Cetraspora pellucida]|uniref:23382_t:CDS:1 n=1 Tax=Cetraspora pellucida TaxID=1433469 RepID=A0A9N8WRD3_9GLOM|nr:23382_t:CDS:2 [Cetraspora pellucida]
MQSEDFDNSQCIKDIGSDQSLTIVHVLYICVENLLCVLFQFFQIYFGFNALFHEQSFQLIAIAVFDLGWSLYGIATIVYGVLMVKAFGKGLKKFFVKSSSKSTSLDEEETNISSPKKWAIDDE